MISVLHLFLLKTPPLGAVMSKKGGPLCALWEQKGVKTIQNNSMFAIPFRKYTLFQIMNQPKLLPGPKEPVVKFAENAKEKAKEDVFKCLLTNSSRLHCKQFVLPSFSTCACPRPKK